MWGPALDISAFAGAAAVALTFVALAPWLAPNDEGGAWAFLVFVIGIDVAHVYSTLFRTYFDLSELKRRPRLYALAPLGALLVLVGVSVLAPERLWTVLAYLALLHFIRQQVGWVAIYRARAVSAGLPYHVRERILDDLTVYAATLYPVLHWHAHLPRRFEWFVPGDFVAVADGAWLQGAFIGYLALLVLYCVNAVRRAFRHRSIELGKHLVVTSTALTWYVGIVATNGDFTFTAANVVTHGAPYFVLLFMYAKRRALVSAGLVRSIVGKGVLGFLAVLVALAFLEELLWDRLVWHTHEALFGFLPPFELSEIGLKLVVPLLMVPQATHYILDAVLWRRGETSAAQAHAMGFARSTLQ
jgi:hypothetical protein